MTAAGVVLATFLLVGSRDVVSPKRWKLTPRQEKTASEVRRAARGIVDPRVLEALAVVESSLRSRARSAAGAVGVLQVMPATARRVLGRPTSRGELLDVYSNARIGATFLRKLIDRHGGDLGRALSAYVGVPFAPKFVEKVFEIYKLRKGSPR